MANCVNAKVEFHQSQRGDGIDVEARIVWAERDFHRNLVAR